MSRTEVDPIDRRAFRRAVREATYPSTNTGWDDQLSGSDSAIVLRLLDAAPALLADDLGAALREALALHQPEPDDYGMGYLETGGYGHISPACKTCGTSDEYAVPWPCDTAKVLSRGLGEAGKVQP